MIIRTTKVKHQGSWFTKSTNGSYISVVKPKSSTPVSNLFSALKEDNGNYMDELVHDTMKKVEALLVVESPDQGATNSDSLLAAARATNSDSIIEPVIQVCFLEA
ncbi:hypothetical protein Tco_1436694 [Tanacetum coccineum]